MAALLRTARSVMTGKQLIGQRHGLATHVGPNALLRSPNYPDPTVVTGPLKNNNGPLFVPPALSNGAPWRIDGNDEIDNTNNGLACNWTAGVTTPYVYNNDPGNLGGIVPSGGLLIDGWEIPAGTLVFQFMDLSYPGGVIIYQGDVNPISGVVFRGCRARNPAGATGFFSNNGGNVQPVREWILYCDLGGDGSDPNIPQLAHAVVDSYCKSLVCYRNYVSFIGSGIFPKAATTFIDLYENYIEQICVFGGDHLNGISFNGGETSCRVKRNSIVIDKFDPNGGQVVQTDCIAFFEDFGGYPGTGTNSDATGGYQVWANYMGGTGYCAYAGGGGDGDPLNMHWVNNLVTASSYAVGDESYLAIGNGGGNFGPLYTGAIPNWGTDGNTETNNIWADGPDRGTTWM